MFLSFILNNKMLIVVLALLAVMAGEGVYITTLKSEKATLVAEKATLTTMLAESQANLKQLQNDIQAQNTAIDVLKKEGDARVAKHVAEVKVAQAAAKSYKQMADDLLNRKPPQGMPKCDAADALINEEIKNAHK
jgi:peptidoglycan hydrolase CwlO-like protein